MLAKTKQWGNSMAVIIPIAEVERLNLKTNQEVDILLKKKANALKELFGSIHFSKSTEQLLKEAKENTSRWD